MTKSLLRSKYIKNCTYENWSNYKKQVLYKYFASILKVSYKYYINELQLVIMAMFNIMIKKKVN